MTRPGGVDTRQFRTGPVVKIRVAVRVFIKGARAAQDGGGDMPGRHVFFQQEAILVRQIQQGILQIRPLLPPERQIQGDLRREQKEPGGGGLRQRRFFSRKCGMHCSVST